MKDLDFDELDQAVSSVLGTNTADSTATTPAADTSPKTAVTSPEPAKVDAVPVAAAKPATPPADAPKASPTVRRRGQFLDMVHPASKMTSQAPASPAARKKVAPVSGDIAVQPTKPTTPPATTEESAPAPSVSAPAVTTPPVEAPATPANETKWPDPLDLMADDEPKKEEAVEAEAATPSAPANNETTTPFVTDAKVDKRPLDAFATADDDKSEATSENEKPADETGAPKPDAEKEKPALMIDTTPPELKPEVVSVESDAGNELVDPNHPEEPEPAEPVSAPAPAEVAPATETGMAQSIPQQYKTPPAAPDSAPHPIFDTHEYHQPLLPATSKKSRGWLIILIIVLLLVVGAALGYFAFMAGL